eukprot:Seg2753.2 transcript_id=Seg2753.2/GoldUCD/mRNA.D3Y31 product="VPS9 domain-containing protein 1" protein_id=Seg2753.2/GoldUCD/D3Y31
MATYVASCLPIAMRAVMDSIQLDNDGKLKEAYCSYLSSMLFIIKTLKDDAWDQDFSKVCNQDTIKLLKLVTQCHERAVDIVSSFKQEGPSATDVPSQRLSMSHSLQAPQTGNLNTSDARDRGRNLDAGSQSLPAVTDDSKVARTASGANDIDKLILSLPTPPTRKGSFNSAAPRSTNVSSIDGIQRNQMFQAYQRRMSLQSNIQQKHKAEYNLCQIRRTVENMAIKKARSDALNKKLEERRERLRIKAEQRFADKTGSRATDAAYEKKIYAKILEFEQETTWPQTLRENLAAQPEDMKLIENIVKRVLGSKEHPLGQLMAEMQFALYRELSLLVSDFACPVYEQPPFKKRRSTKSVDVKYGEVASTRSNTSIDEDACEDCERTIDISEGDKESRRLIFKGMGVKLRTSGTAKISEKEVDSCEAEIAKAEESDKHVEMAEIAALRGEMSSQGIDMTTDPETKVSKANNAEVEMTDVAGLKVACSIGNMPSSVEGTITEIVDEPIEPFAANIPSSDIFVDTGDDVLNAGDTKKSKDSKVDIKMKISSKDFVSEFHDFEEYMLENLDSEDFDLLPDESCVQTDSENMELKRESEKDDFEAGNNDSKDEQEPGDTQEINDITVLPESDVGNGRSAVGDGTRSSMPSSLSGEDMSLKMQPPDEASDSEVDALKDISSDPRSLTLKADEKSDDEADSDSVEPSFQEDTVKDSGGTNVSDRDNGTDVEQGNFTEQNVNETQNVTDIAELSDKDIEHFEEAGKTEDYEGIRNDEECELEDVYENELDTEKSSSSKLAGEDSMDQVNKLENEQVISLDQDVQAARIGESIESKDLAEGKDSKDSQNDDICVDPSDIVEQGSIPSVDKLRVVQKNEVIEGLINELVDRNKKYQTDIGLDFDEKILDDIFDDDISSQNGCSECSKEAEVKGLDGEPAGKNESDSRNTIGSSEQSIGPESGSTYDIESRGLSTDNENSTERLSNEMAAVFEEAGRAPLHSEDDNDVFSDHLIEQYSKCQHNSEDYGKMKKKVDSAVKEVHASLDKLHSLLIFTYDELDLPIGRDQSYAAVETIFFKPLWQWLNLVFRRLNLKKELQMYEVITKRWECGPLDFFVREKYALQEAEGESTAYPYEIAVEELKKIVLYSSPLDKLECLVLTSKLICQCVTDYWIKRGDPSPPRVGCDDLLPILTYVIVKAALPQLVSECHAIEEFINESYLLGEEGYCLTTLSTAIAYVLNLRSGGMPGQSLS